MTALTSIAITLALFLGAAIVIAMRHYYHNRDLLRKNQKLHIQLNAYRDAGIDPAAVYLLRKVATENPEYSRYNGCWSVCRMISKRGYRIETTIKVFTDDDNDFNLREAQEMCDTLIAK